MRVAGIVPGAILDYQAHRGGTATVLDDITGQPGFELNVTNGVLSNTVENVPGVVSAYVLMEPLPQSVATELMSSRGMWS